MFSRIALVIVKIKFEYIGELLQDRTIVFFALEVTGGLFFDVKDHP